MDPGAEDQDIDRAGRDRGGKREGSHRQIKAWGGGKHGLAILLVALLDATMRRRSWGLLNDIALPVVIAHKKNGIRELARMPSWTDQLPRGRRSA
jgi:hypothetical protein